MKKTKLDHMPKVLGFLTVIMLLLFSCSKDEVVEPVTNPLKGYSSGTNNGYFWSLWTSDGMTGSVNYSNGSGGNYSVSWNCNGNFTCGKGWSSGSKTRIVGYNCGSYSQPWRRCRRSCGAASPSSSTPPS